MSLLHVALALLVITIWGVNFIFVKIGLQEISPLLLCTLRFILSSIPAVFFIRPPKVSFKKVILYGLVMFALQFSLVFLGMQAGMTAGLTSLLMQVQIFFSLFFAVLFLGEQPNIWQLFGALVAFTGIGVVAMHLNNQTLSLGGFLLILTAASAWGLGNLITKKTKNVNMMALVVWGSFAAVVPMVFLTLIFEGFSSISQAYHHITWKGAGSLFYIVYASTWVGYGLWNWLLSRYAVGIIVPFTLLIPVVGMVSSTLMLGESFERWKLAAVMLVLAGLGINLFGGRFFAARVAQPQTP